MGNFEESVFTPWPEQEKESKVKIIMVQGMADLGPTANNIMADFIDAEAYDPVWKDQEPLEAKLGRLSDMIDQANEEGKIVVLVGISAGAGLAELHMLRKGPDSGVRCLYSVGGVLSPNLDTENEQDKEKWIALKKDHPAFTSMVDELHERLKDPKAIKASGLPEKIKAYISQGDDIVPIAALEPKWLKKKKYVNKGNHVMSIVGGLIGEIRRETSHLTGKSFE